MDGQRLHEVIFKLIETNKLHKMAIETAVDEIGLHRNRHHLLMYIARHESFSSQKEIADRLGVTPAAITMSLTALERDGLIVRKSGADSRSNKITVTDKGRELIDRSRTHFTDVDIQTFAGLSESEIDALESCLDKIINNLKNKTEDSNEKMV